MSKCIWYVTKYFSPKTTTSPGGRGWFLMRELALMGHQPIVITSDSNNLVDVPTLNNAVEMQYKDGVTLVWLKTLKYKTAKSFHRVISWFHFELNLLRLNKDTLPKPDVIVISSLSLLTILNGIILKKKFNCPLSFEVRDIWPLTLVAEGGFSPNNPLVKFLGVIEKLGYRKSDSIIGTMPALNKHIERVGVHGKKVTCVPMGYSEEHLYGLQELPQSYVVQYLSSDKFKVIHAGTIGITNALDTLFDTAYKLRSNTRIEFIIVGDGALKDHYKNRYGSLPNIVFAPKVNRLQVQAVLQKCQLVYFSVYKSEIWDYGQSLNKLIDYMLSGKPVVASFSGFPSMINESGCGTFVEAENSEALKNELVRYSSMTEQELAEIGNLGREWLLENRSYKKLSREFLEATQR